MDSFFRKTVVLLSSYRNLVGESFSSSPPYIHKYYPMLALSPTLTQHQEMDDGLSVTLNMWSLMYIIYTLPLHIHDSPLVWHFLEKSGSALIETL